VQPYQAIDARRFLPTWLFRLASWHRSCPSASAEQQPA